MPLESSKLFRCLAPDLATATRDGYGHVLVIAGIPRHGRRSRTLRGRRTAIRRGSGPHRHRG